MKKIRNIALSMILLTAIISCKKGDQQTDFKKYLGDHELVYTGAVNKVIVQPGNLEIALKWKSSSDPSITRYVIYYNNKTDSSVVNVSTPTDTIRTVIKGLSEYTYSFTIYSFDALGNRSIPFEVNNAKVYGPIYESNLLNRGYDAANPYLLNDDGSLVLNFIAPDTINIKTLIHYTNAQGVASTATLAPQDKSIRLPSYKLATPISYQSFYIPERDAIDTFKVTSMDDFPRIFSYVLCDKNQFKDGVSLPNDVHADFGTSLSKLWDGSVGPQAYPNIFHTDSEHGMPHTFTFDLGKTYENLGRVEETGRDGYHNPGTFEVWGIADLTNAATALPANNSGWKSEMISKGWVLLKECVRTDDGTQPLKFELNSNGKSVRYIRIRVTKDVDNDQTASNWGELTFWNKQ
ncbi:DUF4998 domain-containing protein [Mucilaginibacter sp. SG564]|uniref:DUF4998 domain-containing protein n=1 Tax=Mucilaginibacter sp. SG564 TaxID=2587022 RepID=UPI0020A67A7A|nr:DUF4998 domain-containing protein [Mucilaginibacter sp. SG564]NOW96037.1 hypothetical protein [Mucilaginibacter sp. SG564]